jgi:hypothetical protein
MGTSRKKRSISVDGRDYLWWVGEDIYGASGIELFVRITDVSGEFSISFRPDRSPENCTVFVTGKRFRSVALGMHRQFRCPAFATDSSITPAVIAAIIKWAEETGPDPIAIDSWEARFSEHKARIEAIAISLDDNSIAIGIQTEKGDKHHASVRFLTFPVANWDMIMRDAGFRVTGNVTEKAVYAAKGSIISGRACGGAPEHVCKWEFDLKESRDWNGWIKYYGLLLAAFDIAHRVVVSVGDTVFRDRESLQTFAETALIQEFTAEELMAHGMYRSGEGIRFD